MKNFILLTFILLIKWMIPIATSANILCLMGMPSKSHHIWNRPLMVALAEQGHNVTALSVDVDKDVTPNLHYIYMEGLYNDREKFYLTADMSAFVNKNPLQSIMVMYNWFSKACSTLLDTAGVAALNNYPQDFKFDVVIHDFTIAQCLLGFVHKFNNPPLISISAFNMPTYTTFVSGNPQFPAYVPLMTLAYSSDMTIVQRGMNLAYHAFDRFYRHFFYMPAVNKVATSYFGPNLPDLTTIERNTSITFINTDPSIDISQPLLPNVIPVGGIHILKPNMTKTLGTILDVLTGDKDVIFFSLGSNIRSDVITADRIQILLDAFSKFPEYNILWKYESNNLKEIPKNLLIQKWMPQNEILSSPKVKLFITHAGMLSTQEAVYHGVPMLGMPFFVDQHQNLHKSIIAGVAEKLDYNNLSVDIIVDKIKTLLTNPSYQINIKRRQAAFRKKLNTPMETALFWVNYVIDNKGANHFRTVLPDMPLWKLLMLDVTAIFVGGAILVYVIIKRIIKTVFKLKPLQTELNKKHH